jgi:hypothetical protein
LLISFEMALLAALCAEVNAERLLLTTERRLERSAAAADAACPTDSALEATFDTVLTRTSSADKAFDTTFIAEAACALAAESSLLVTLPDPPPAELIVLTLTSRADTAFDTTLIAFANDVALASTDVAAALAVAIFALVALTPAIIALLRSP